MKTVQLELSGVKYELLYDFNAFAAAESVTGKSMFDAETWKATSATQIRAVIWAGMLHAQPDITIEEVGALIGIENIEEVGNALAGALSPAAPKDGDNPLPPAEPAPADG